MFIGTFSPPKLDEIMRVTRVLTVAIITDFILIFIPWIISKPNLVHKPLFKPFVHKLDLSGQRRGH